MEITKEDVDLNLIDLERAAINLMCNSDSDESDLEDQMAQLSLKKKKTSSAMLTDLQVAAEAARMSSSSSDSEVDSDDASSTEESN